MLDLTMQKSWSLALQDEFESDYFVELDRFLDEESKEHVIYPKVEDIFRAFKDVALQDIKVVILGQDPYHGEGQGHGLAFSVQDGVKYPPSLVNILKELKDDIGCEIPKSGNLTKWANEGVFMINTILSVSKAKPLSHKNKGWEKFSDKTIQIINDRCKNVVFVLWGKPAQTKSKLIDETKHLIIKSPHPSPLSSYRGFFGSKPFSTANSYLKNHSRDIVDWCLNS